MTRSLVAVNLPYAGLGNRLRFTLSAQAVAEAEGRAFSYVWPTSPDFDARFTDLWRFDATEIPGKGGPYLAHTDDLTALRDEPEWVVKSASPIKGDGTERSWEARLAALPLAPHLADAVDQFHHDRLSGRYVGVQIRASVKTHEKTLDASPVSWFTGRMRDLLAADPDTRFFLSCDVPDVQAAVLAEFPSAVALPVPEGYNSRAGIEKAVVDLGILKDATHLLGPYWSSFVEMAWIMGGKRVDLEDSQRTKRAVVLR